MSVWALAHFFACIVNLFMAMYIVWKDSRRVLNWLCAGTVFLFSLWSFGTTFMRDPWLEKNAAVVFNHIASIGWISFSAGFLLFAHQFYRENAVRKRKSRGGFIVSVVLIIPLVFSILQWNGMFMREYRLERYGWVGVWPAETVTYLFYFYYVVCVLAGLVIIARVRRASARLLVKKQSRIMIFSVIVSLLLGSFSSIIMRHAGVYSVPPLGDVFTVIFAVGFLYATVRYRLFEFSPAAVANKILDTMTDGLLLIDTKGMIVECNPALLKMLGYSHDELLNKRFTAIIPERIFNSSYIKELLRNESFANRKGSLLRKDGSEVPVLASAGVIKDEDEVAGFVMVVHDYTDLENAEMRLVRLLETAKTILDWVPFGVVTVGREGKIRTANKYAREVIGIHGDEIVGMDCHRILCTHGGINCPFKTQQRECKNIEVELATSVDRKVPILKSVMRVNLDGEDTLIETFIDITDLKRARDELIFARDAAEAANRAKSAFLANMSHEIRTPLNAILGFAQILKLEEKDQAKKEKLSVIMQSGENLLRILNDILDFSRIEAGKIDLFNVDFSLEELCGEILAIFSIRAKEKGIGIEGRRIDGALPRVRGDKQRITQIVSNLVDNAIKFTEEGSVTLEYRFEDGKVVFRVIDTGIGIPPEKQFAIFQPFDQVDPSITRRYGGTGLGLAIVRQLVEMMQGTIECCSAVGEGTVFTVALPLAVSPMTEERMPKPEAETDKKIPQQNSASALKVLVVEDNDLNQKLLCRLLEMLEMEFDSAFHGKEALKKLECARKENKPFDLVLLDIQMPVMDGLECIAEIRANPLFNGVFVVALTAHALLGDAERLKSAGFDEYMSKPIDINDFFNRMKSFAEKIRQV